MKMTSKFQEIKTSKSIRKEGVTIRIVKFKKAGTNRVFWAPVLKNGDCINSVMYARMCDAVSLAKRSLEWLFSGTELADQYLNKMRAV